MKMAPGARAWAKLREDAPMVRKTMDKVNVVKNEKTTKTKNASGVRLKFVMKYRTRLNAIQLQILYGKSQRADEIASVNGW